MTVNNEVGKRFNGLEMFFSSLDARNFVDETVHQQQSHKPSNIEAVPGEKNKNKSSLKFSAESTDTVIFKCSP